MRATKLVKIISQELALFDIELQNTFPDAAVFQELDHPNQVKICDVGKLRSTQLSYIVP